MVGLMVMFKKTPAKGHLPGLLLPVLPSLKWATADPGVCRRPSKNCRHVCFILLWDHCDTPFPWVLFHIRFCLCSLRMESLFPPVLWKSYSQILLPSRSSSLGIPSPFVGSPGREAWCGVQNLHNSERTSLVLLFSSLQVIHQQVWNLILSWLHPFYHFSVVSSLSLDVEYPFVVGSSVLLLMVIQQLVVILMLSQKKMLSFLSCNRQHGQWGKFGKIATLSFQNNFSFLSYAMSHRTILFSLLITPDLFFSSLPFSQENWFRSRKNEDLWLRGKSV